MPVGGASAGDRGRDLRGEAAQARARRVETGKRGSAGQSETAKNRQAKAWSAGAKGEERTAFRLDGLRAHGVTTLHDRLLQPDKAWNLDHLVVAPAGVFFVDAKNWRGRLSVYRGTLWRHWYAGSVAGRQSASMQAEVNKVAGMSAKASQRLGVTGVVVQGVIALAGAQSKDLTEVLEVGGVRVVSVHALSSWIRDQPAVVDRAQVAMLVSIAERVFPPAVVADTGEVVRQREWDAAMGRVPRPKD